MRFSLRIYLLLGLFLTSVCGVQAQSLKGSILGSVVNQIGETVSGASLALTSEDTSRKWSTISDSHGGFVISLLPAGTYDLEVYSPGFLTVKRKVEVRVGREIHLDFILRVGGETVNVVAEQPMVKTETASQGAVIDNRQVRGLPLNGRNFMELSLLVPGTVPAAPGSAGSVRGDLAMNINGAREDSNAFLLDGVYNGDPKLNTVAVTPPVDAIQEFELLTSSYDASFGRNSGGQVNVLTKSGTNGLHGTAYEFFRNAALDGRNYFAPAKEPDPRYQRNQFGASLGGPIRKNKTFFFGDYEGRRVREGITRVTNVPTALERIGDFSQSDPRTPPIDLFTQAPYLGSKIPVERQHPIGRAIAALYPLPNRLTPFQNFVSSPISRDRDDHMDARVDHAISNVSDLAVRYSFSDRALFEPFSGPGFSVIPGYGTDIPRRSQNLMLSETHVFSSNVLNEARAGFSRVALGVTQEHQGISLNKQLGLPDLSTNPRDFGLTFITIPGYSPLGDEGNNPQHGVTNTFQYIDNLTLTRGRHIWKFGGEFRALQQNAFRDVQSRGFINFLGFTGNPLAELLMGLPGVSGGARLDNPQHLRTKSYSFFAQDGFRMRPNLTLTMGVRYEYNSPAVDAQDRANVYNPAARTLVAVGKNGFPRSGYDPDRNNFAPRLGIAWTPGSNRTTVLRAGYGVYFDQSALAPGEGLYFSAPYFDLKLYFTLLPDLPLLLHDPFPKNFPIPVPSSALAFQRDLRTGYLQHWNMSIQQQIGTARTFELAYVGSKGTKLLAGRDINQPLRPSPISPNLRPQPQFDDIDILESRGNSVYNSMQASVQQRYHKGLTLMGSYTWAKSIDDASGFFSSAGDPNFPQDSYNVRAERARSNFDIRHRFSASYSYDLPLAKGHRYLGGWQTFGVLAFQTGRPFTVALRSDDDNSNTGRTNLGFGANDRPNVIGKPGVSDPSPDRWFNTGAFAKAPYGSFGNAGRNILDGPGSSTVDVSLLKNTLVSERLNVQFRAEAFNLFDRANFDLPDIFVGSPTFGKIQSAGSPRLVQLGLKFIF